MTKAERKLHIVQQDAEDDLLFELETASHYSPLLSNKIFKASATCVEVRKFSAFGRENFRLTMMIFDPPECEGDKIFIFAPFREKWKKTGLPTSAKIHKMAVIATDQRRLKRITKSMFTNKAFLIRVRPSGEGDAAYSVGDIIKRLAG